MSPRQQILKYHERTKHFPDRTARSPGYMDWATQPDPFRRFAGAALTPLPLPARDAGPDYDDLFAPGVVEPVRVNLASISAMLELSLGLSAVKQLGPSQWALRMNPSSGNLHPTEGYLIVGPIAGLEEGGGVFHYAPKEHALERRGAFAADVWPRLAVEFPPHSFFVGLSSIHWREAWKYGERAYRYCQHDVGHAAAAVAIAAALCGWRAFSMDAMGDDEVAALLGLDRAGDFDAAEPEHPDLLLAVVPGPYRRDDVATCLPGGAVAQVAASFSTGQANALSPGHVDWHIIDVAADAGRKPAGEWLASQAEFSALAEPRPFDRPSVPAATIIRQRRSAVAMDGETALTSPQFYRMLERTMPRIDRTPWSAIGSPACVHLVLFVHLVEGLPPGLYCLARSSSARPKLEAAMRRDFAWTSPPNSPETLPLFLLEPGDFRAVAWRVSCGQQIAGAGALSLGMIAEFEPRLRQHGAWLYRRLFWETGVIGQMLYLEAEVAGVRGTGIGCFFDDAVHEVFGLTGTTFQSLYHFTIGGAVDDSRLTTFAPYPQRNRPGVIDSPRQVPRPSSRPGIGD